MTRAVSARQGENWIGEMVQKLFFDAQGMIEVDVYSVNVQATQTLRSL